MSKEVKPNFIPNSFQITNDVVDLAMANISGNSLKCYLLIIRKTRGWQKEKDSISISQFIKYTGIKRPETITKSINELLENGLITSYKIKGKITKYSPLNHPQKTVPPLKNSSTKKPLYPPLKNRCTSTPKKPCTTKDTIKNTIIKTKEKNKKEIIYPDNLNIQVWKRWIIYKKEIKKNYKTITGEQSAINKLSTLSNENQVKCIDDSISNEYQGFFIDKYTGQNYANNNTRKLTPAEQHEIDIENLIRAANAEDNELSMGRTYEQIPIDMET